MGWLRWGKKLDLEATTPSAPQAWAPPSHDAWLSWRGWRPISVRTALSLPGVFRANVLITDVASEIDLYEERKVIEEDRVRWERLPTARPIIRRPDPAQPAPSFTSEVVANLAGPGECFLIVDRPTGADPNGIHLADLRDIDLSWDADHRPVYKYLGEKMRPWTDIIHLYHYRPPGELHGIGPIQAHALFLIGAGDTEDWARAFFTESGVHSVSIEVPYELDRREALQLQSDWMADHQSPKPAVLSGGAKAAANTVEPDKAQALQTRMWNVQMTAAAYGINPYLLAVAMQGGNITYQTLPDLFAELIRGTIYPTYLRKIEDAFTELLPASRRARFDLTEFTQADEKTRMETYEIGTRSGVLEVDEARAREGLPRTESQPAAPDPAEAFSDLGLAVSRMMQSLQLQGADRWNA